MIFQKKTLNERDQLHLHTSSSTSIGTRMMDTLLGLQSTPWLSLQEKYLCPDTVPLFFPRGSSNSTPHRSTPFALCFPKNRSVPGQEYPWMDTLANISHRNKAIFTSSKVKHHVAAIIVIQFQRSLPWLVRGGIIICIENDSKLGF
eukprot:m.135340 g.135340  ORF g.135340 m.135340 type:complete len:146 (+) comp13118_c0_seq1:1484-1921(+)